MRKRSIICDRCGRTIYDEWDSIPIMIRRCMDTGMILSHVRGVKDQDICKDCADEFHAWLKEEQE